jgi:hypothetical protein
MFNPYRRRQMRFQSIVLAVLLALSGSVIAGEKTHGTDDLTPKHGGVVSQARNDIDFELVAKADVLTLYVRDHGKPVDTKGGSGKIQLLVGTDKTEATLAPAGENRLQAKGNFKVGKGTKAVATVQLPGKQPSTVRFSIN